jgi:hypothetical protein
MVGKRSDKESLKSGYFRLKFSDPLHAPLVALDALAMEPEQILKLCLRFAH